MHSLVKDLMTTQVVTVGPATPFKEIVARLAKHRVSAVPDTVEVEVRDGVVTLTGRLERASPIPILVSLVRGIDGVVDVVDRLTFADDDTPSIVPSDLLLDRAPPAAAGSNRNGAVVTMARPR